MPTILDYSVTELIRKFEERSVTEFLDPNLEYVRILHFEQSQIPQLPHLFSFQGCPKLYIELFDVNLEFVRQIGSLLSTGQCPPNLTLNFLSTPYPHLPIRTVVEVMANALTSGNCPQNLSISFVPGVRIRSIDDAGATILANALATGRCPPGLSLDISQHSCTLVGIKRIADALQTGQCPMNLGIKLGGNRLCVPSVAAIADGLACTRSPVGLNLSFRTHWALPNNPRFCAIDSQRAQIIARSLQLQSPADLSIDLYGNFIGTAGTNAFAHVLSTGKYPSNLSLDFSYTDILPDGTKAHIPYRDASTIADVLTGIQMNNVPLKTITTGHPNIDRRIAVCITGINAAVSARIEAHRAQMRLYGNIPVPQDVLADQMRDALQIDTEEMFARMQLMTDANRSYRSALIRERTRSARMAASTGLFKPTYRQNLSIIDDLISFDYIPHKDDLPLLHQMAFSIQVELTNRENTIGGRITEFVLPEKHNYSVAMQSLKGKIATLLPLQLKNLIIDVTASDSWEDLLKSHMFLLSSDSMSCLVFSHDYYKKFILNSNSTQLNAVEWSHLYLFRSPVIGGEYASIVLGDLGEIFDLFPMFKNAYWGLKSSLLTQYLTLVFGSNRFVLEHMAKAINSSSSRDKWVDVEKQEMLIVCLRPFFQAGSINFDKPSDNNGAVLTPSSLADIFRIFEHTNALSEKKNYLLIGLALIFVELSSQRLLGTDTSSPIALRLFAVALLNHIQKDARFFSEIQTWKNRLLGAHGAYTCSGIVANILSESLKTHRPEVLNFIYPKAWK